MTDVLAGRGWRALAEGGDLGFHLSGDWRAREGAALTQVPDSLLDRPNLHRLFFESGDLGHWDSSLLVFLSSLHEGARRRAIIFDQTGLPASARRLLALVPPEVPAAVLPARSGGLIERFGRWLLERWSDFVALTALVGETTLRTVPTLRGKAQMRRVDLLACIQDAGIAALSMVGLVNVLVGGIVAFVGGIQLRRLGAEIYVSNVIGVAEVREMAPLMTAIVLSGRTGSAYAAQIAAMQGSEEIDSLRAFGIPIFDYLILPREFALSAMMPLLYLYAAALGIFGGFAVAVQMMHLPAGGFISHLRSAVAGADIVLGLAKSLAFGSWIAIVACRIGLRAGRSASDVGQAATTAAVSGIVGVIALDAVFDVCANALGI